MDMQKLIMVWFAEGFVEDKKDNFRRVRSAVLGAVNCEVPCAI